MSQTYQVIFYNDSTTRLPTSPGRFGPMGSQVCIYLENTNAPTDTLSFPWVIQNVGPMRLGSNTLQWSDDMSIGFILGWSNYYGGGNQFTNYQNLSLPQDVNVLNLSGMTDPGGWPFYNNIIADNNGTSGTYTITLYT